MTKTISPALIGLMLIWPVATGLTLPRQGPTPDKRPEIAEPQAERKEEAASPENTEVPTPEKKPAAPAAEEAAPAKSEDTAEQPKDDGKQAEPDADKTEPAKVEPPADPPPAPEDPKELAACLADLKAVGATFKTQTAIDGETGCGMAAPVTLSKLLPDVALEPEATFRCETALQLARMTRDMVKPAAAIAFRDKPALSAVLHASGYVCRKRNSAETGKISEHAYGNAVDIAGLRFGKEDEPVMIAKQDDGTAKAAFQRAFNAFACLYFTTVLSPGSDATHQDHMHLDVIKRKSGYRYCR